jgi:hypothetical protein
MTKEQIKAVLDRVLTWPPERQQDAAEVLLRMEAQTAESYEPTEEEWAAIQEGLDQIRRGDVISAEEMDEYWKRRDP